MTARYIGQPQNRVDGPDKVTGAARYAAEYNVPDLLYGYVVSSTVASGKIKKIDATRALGIAGVIKVYTHENRPTTARLDRNYRDDAAPPGSPFRPLNDEGILFSGQPVALVVADSFETARYGASLIEVEYNVRAHKTDLKAERANSYKPPPRSGIPAPAKERGKPEEKLKSAAIQQRAEYVLPMEYHNPMELFGTTVIYETD